MSEKKLVTAVALSITFLLTFIVAWPLLLVTAVFIMGASWFIYLAKQQ